MQTDDISEGVINHDDVRRYGLAILAVIVALLLRRFLAPLLGENNPYHTLWPAVVFSAWYCGLGPSLVTTFWSGRRLVLVLATLPFLFTSGPRDCDFRDRRFLVLFRFDYRPGETNRRSLAKSRWAEDQLRKAHDELERKVAERTADLNIANQSLRELSGRLQQMRDEERRQIARELHDSVGQLLAALSMNIGVVQLQADRLDSIGARAVSENAAVVDQISREIRTISHLLHPPLLDVAGLASALR
jgi:signal transduction histidine kinase